MIIYNHDSALALGGNRLFVCKPMWVDQKENSKRQDETCRGKPRVRVILTGLYIVSQRVIRFCKFTSIGAVQNSTYPNSNTPMVVPLSFPTGGPAKGN